MRKFRGLQTYGKKWVYGHLVVFGVEHRIYRGTGEDDYAIVRGDTVGQSTGLKDKAGGEIFEGDILDAGDRIVKVVWWKYTGQWDTIFMKYTGGRTSNGITAAEWGSRAMIIGNIHE